MVGTTKFATLNDLGQEVPDDEPIVIRVNNRKITDLDSIRAMIRGELSDSAARYGYETWEESNDFDCDDDDAFPKSEHEYTEEQEAADRDTLMERMARNEGAPGRGDPELDGAPASPPSPSPPQDSPVPPSSGKPS